jgi:hypothetical protein
MRGGGQGVTAKAEVLNYPVVGRQEGPEHESNLQSQVDSNTPHFEPDNHTGEVGFQCDN